MTDRSEAELSIFLDMDGVLVDIVGPILDLYSSRHLLDDWLKGCYDLDVILDVGRGELWERVNAMPVSWWEWLPAFRWLDTLWEGLQPFGPVTILSLPQETDACVLGKRRWLDRKIGPGLDVVLSGRKTRLARPGAVLIDDSEHHIRDWEAAGGHGILFPQVWNPAEPIIDGRRYGCPAEYTLERLRRISDETRRTTTACKNAD